MVFFSFFLIVYIVTSLSFTAVTKRLTTSASHPVIIQPDYYAEELTQNLSVFLRFSCVKAFRTLDMKLTFFSFSLLNG